MRLSTAPRGVCDYPSELSYYLDFFTVDFLVVAAVDLLAATLAATLAAAGFLVVDFFSVVFLAGAAFATFVGPVALAGFSGFASATVGGFGSASFTMTVGGVSALVTDTGSGFGGGTGST